LTKLTNKFDGSGTGSFDYTHDKVGNRLTMTVDDTDEHSYDYDVLYQLIDVNYPDNETVTYRYDKLGNRTSVVNGGTTSYLRNRLNQYTSVSGVNYSYDDNGNLADDGTYKYYYDCENRLTDVNDQSDDRVASYKYDYLGRRVKKTIHETQTTIHYCYDGTQVIAEYNSNGTLLRAFIYGDGIDEPICMAGSSGTLYYYHFDGLGSVAALTDVNGTFVEYYEYNVFGEPTIWDVNTMEIVESSVVGNPYMFTGREYDSETDLYYYRARYYRPSIGRFLQPDPIGYVDSYNLYTYCGNNPPNWIDPWGLKPGDTYLGQDSAATAASLDIYGKTTTSGREHGGWIYRKWYWPKGVYSYTEPVRGEPTSVNLGRPTRGVSGFYHSHPSVPGYLVEIFSLADKNVAKSNNVGGYLVTPTGQIKKYNPKTQQSTDLNKIGPYYKDPSQQSGKCSKTASTP